MSFGENVLSVFPPPALLLMQSAGIDISESSVKCVFLKQSGHSTFLQSYTETPLKKGVIVDGDIEMRGKILEVLRSYRLRQGVRYAHASIPEKKHTSIKHLYPVTATMCAPVSSLVLRRMCRFRQMRLCLILKSYEKLRRAPLLR